MRPLEMVRILSYLPGAELSSGQDVRPKAVHPKALKEM